MTWAELAVWAVALIGMVLALAAPCYWHVRERFRRAVQLAAADGFADGYAAAEKKMLARRYGWYSERLIEERLAFQVQRPESMVVTAVVS